jgi:chitinase
VSTNPKSDYEDTTPSEIDPSMPRNHFAEYEVYSEKYPDVNIMISVGGWTASGYFSEMAYTKEGRQSFVQSCLDLMEKYPWIDGIDIDWEYPGGTGSGERAGGEGDQGCPIFGTVDEDKANFTAMLKDMNEAFDAKYGVGVKKITSCASCSTGWTLPYQDWAAAAPYLDLINIMTYDMAGSWDGITGHTSSMGGVRGAVEYFKNLGISASKLNIGTPLYATGFQMKEIDKTKIVGAAIEPVYINGDSLTQDTLNQFEKEAVSGYITNMDGMKAKLGEAFENGGTGWHIGYDAFMDASYLYNDNPDSEYYKYYLSYESPVSLQAKLDYINEEGLAGIIIWECSQDAEGFSMITQMASNLLLPTAVARVYDTNGNLVKNAIVSMTLMDGTKRAVYAKEDGTMAAGEIITYKGTRYYCDGSGAIVFNKIITCKGSMYYATESGKLAEAGTVVIRGYQYEIGKDGKIEKISAVK